MTDDAMSCVTSMDGGFPGITTSQRTSAYNMEEALHAAIRSGDSHVVRCSAYITDPQLGCAVLMRYPLSGCIDRSAIGRVNGNVLPWTVTGGKVDDGRSVRLQPRGPNREDG